MPRGHVALLLTTAEGWELGLAKSTLHQHALILRTAGLIRLRLDSSAGLELNPDPPDVGRLLGDLLKPGEA